MSIITSRLSLWGSEVVLVYVVDYTVVATNHVQTARVFISFVLFSFLTKYRILLEQSWAPEPCPIHRVSVVVEAKDRVVKLDDNISQVVTQLYAAATILKCDSFSSFSDSAELTIGQEISYTGNIDERLRMAASLCLIST